MSNNYDLLWVEKYRPKTLEQMALDEDFRGKFQEFYDKKEIGIINVVLDKVANSL